MTELQHRKFENKSWRQALTCECYSRQSLRGCVPNSHTLCRLSGCSCRVGLQPKNLQLTHHQLYQKSLSSTFQPLAVTALEVWDERSICWLRRFSDVCPAAAGADAGGACDHLMRHLLVALSKRNSRLLCLGSILILTRGQTIFDLLAFILTRDALFHEKLRASY